LPAQFTRLLSVLLIAAVALLLLAWSRLDKVRAQAVASQRDLAVCTADLADIPSTTMTEDALPPTNPEDPELNRRLRDAAVAAGVPDELVSIEPGPPHRVGITDYNETIIALRLNVVTLRQLTVFLYSLSAKDPNMRSKLISLSLPGGANQFGPVPSTAPATTGPSETWTADISLAYLSLAPRGRTTP